LGYYSRGRNMLKTARFVAEHYNGIFPQQYNQLIKLKGIGEYTASAISSFSANEAKAVVDGNVYRVLARYFGIDEPINSPKGKKDFQVLANELLNHDQPINSPKGKKDFQVLANELLNYDQPGLHNQAMMEFGAMLCKPKNPACSFCPVRTGCFAFKNNATTSLPVKLKTVKVRERFFNYFLIFNNNEILLNKRDEKDIWANMYDLPLIETSGLILISELLALPKIKDYFGENIEIQEISPVYKHILTHQRLHVRFINLQTRNIKLQQNWFFSRLENLEKFALPKIIFIFIKNIFNL